MLEISNINVSFRSERQEKLFGTTRDQVLFDVSLKVPQGTCHWNPGGPEAENPPWAA